MKWVKKILKWLGIVVLGILLIGNLAIVFTGRYYIYKAIASTYFRGNVRPHIYDHEVFENRSIPSGTAQPWQEDFRSKLAFTGAERERVENLNPASFLVVWGDTVIYEEYWEEHDRSATSNSFSMAKTIVALMIGIAIEEGKIGSMDDPVANYLPEFEGEKGKVTIRHVLTMSTGLEWSEIYAHPFSDVAELYYDTDARDLSLNRREVEDEPGIYWDYKSGDTQVLTYLLEAATGKKASDYASEKLWMPMGAESDAMWSLVDDQNSTEKGYCCFYSTTRDFARLGKLINNRGSWNGKQLVNEDYVNQMCQLAPLTKKENDKPNNAYGLHYWIYTGFPYEVTYFRGMNGQYIYSVPSKDLVIVRTGDGTEGNVKNTNKAVEDQYAETPFYVEVGVRMLEEHTKK